MMTCTILPCLLALLSLDGKLPTELPIPSLEQVRDEAVNQAEGLATKLKDMVQQPGTPQPQQEGASPPQEEPLYTITQLEDLTAMLEECSRTLRSSVSCQFSPKAKKQLRHLSRYQGFFHYCNQFSYKDPGTGTITFHPGYRDSIRMLAATQQPELGSSLSARHKKALAQAQEMVARLIKPGMGDEEKALALHDVVVATTSYNRSKGEASDVLLNHWGRCEAYANTMQLLLSLAGLPNRLVHGSAKGGSHAWNLVQVDGVWCHLDATWDDPVIRGGRKQILHHMYFLANDQQMRRDHRWKQDDLPLCDGQEAPYYQKRGLYFTSFPPFWDAVSAAIAKGKREFEAYFPNSGSKRKFQDSLQEARELHPNLAAVGSFLFPGSQKGGVIHLEFTPNGSATEMVEETEDAW